MTERELTKKLEKLGYTRSWLDFDVLTLETLLEQEQHFDESDDKNTEHYRYGTCDRYLRSKGILSDQELDHFLELLKNDPNTYVTTSAAIDIFKLIELSDNQFDRLSEQVNSFGDWTGKIVLRQRFLRKLKKEEPTDELISNCIVKGDSFVQNYLLEHIGLKQDQLKELSIQGKNKQIRTNAQKYLKP